MAGVGGAERTEEGETGMLRYITVGQLRMGVQVFDRLGAQRLSLQESDRQSEWVSK